MKKLYFFLMLSGICLSATAQTMTPEKLWGLERVSPIGLTNDREQVIFSTRSNDINSNSSSSKNFVLSLKGGEPIQIKSYDSIFTDTKVSPSGEYKIVSKEVKIQPVSGEDFYPEMKKSDVYIYDDLNYRHWDTWEDGKYSHLFIKNRSSEEEWDIMEGEPHDTPLQPFGGSEDYIWNKDGSKVFYVSKKVKGREYAESTNTDIYSYDIASKTTTNLTDENEGYDTSPAISKNGTLAWLQMDEPGYEADKNDIIVLKDGEKLNLTKDWDGTVSSFLWSEDGKKLFFIAPTMGTKQLFEVNIPGKASPEVKQITKGQFDITGMVGQSDKKMVVTRTDMNHASEIYTVNLKSGKMDQLTHANDAFYNKIKLSEVEKRMIPTTDGKEMLTWVIYPPDFDPNKKYPTLLYLQGGPQSPLSQFYSFRWNFQLMAAKGYIVVAPNRRGMPGYGVEWNEQISGDWGGQNMKDYLSAIDELSKEDFIDKERIGAVGASYGGYSVYYLAGHHDNRFKTFIAHDGIFNTRSMYGTTEELFFVNKDLEGAYWQSPTPKAYTEFNPINFVEKWNTPMLIIQGGKDFRVPIGQGLEAFQAAQLKGLKSKLLYFPMENHWILSAQNGIIWQREFFKWLEETL
ncbi:Dipeptidyl aminopeptidase/acylaminoacyl peptidase [Salegentibacter holothuriorum]|uniref:Dipeptidyl aminopeptidase/acylaminoacyl peptidase n=1 Tax=Salegentibacter holothuriorum TaxID=241145 RepID=A0A1T5AVG7_9FLAO|nr:S9 family peptidase [Salegentibacter holothuriorum]SKB38965.1 Dipeptidyl aminopeptidase/acylaminoacyl peptidase [Salegentibacter holothuriorum]